MILRRVPLYFIICSAALTLPCAAQQSPQPPPPLVSPEVHADRTVTFRFRDPNAHAVTFNREGAKPVPMTKDDAGVWSITTQALEPDLYGYTFSADGLPRLDPSNIQIKPNLLGLSNIFHVPGASPLPWEVTDVPHGELHRHFYRSAIIGDNRDYFVYTPPHYKATEAITYPVLYLLHGYSDDASGWSAVGKANLILDNLIAQGRAKPMIVVMPLGYGAPEIVTRTPGAFRNKELRERNFNRFRDALFTEVLPAIERDYRVTAKREARAIAGLSMGGAETLLTGLNTLDQFAYVGAFSSGGLGDDLAAVFPSLDQSANAKLRVFWISCGREDGLFEANKKLVAWLEGKGIKPAWHETPGAHTWMVWRRNLTEFTQLLFQERPVS